MQPKLDAVMAEPNTIHTAVETAKQIGRPFEVNGVQAVLVPADCKVETFERLYPVPEWQPAQLNEKISVEDAYSFIAYYNRFANDDSTVFVDTDSATFTAVIDYHKDETETRWGKHILSYKCPKTTEWSIWRSENGRSNAKEQEEFALFIEQNLDEIREPAAAEMLEIALSLRAKNNLNFQSAIRLDNGQNQLTYIENIEGAAGAQGQLSIPDEIVLGISPFKGGEPYEVKAKYRYRINHGKLVMWYDLIRPSKVHDCALRDVRAQIEKGIEKGMIINGSR
jgi:uncharacterized protein YfdQ (DUF2303 family)